MHEFSIASAVVDTAIRFAEGRPVTCVVVQHGRLRQVVPDSLEFAFGILSRETVCEGARLQLEEIPARIRCDSCERDFELTLPVFRCLTCGTVDVEVTSGEELLVDSIEVAEEKEHACIG